MMWGKCIIYIYEFGKLTECLDVQWGPEGEEKLFFVIIFNHKIKIL